MSRRAFVLLALALLAAGCGGNNATISGKVTYKGRAVTSGAVVVRNPDQTATKGAIQPDGTYSVSGVARGRVEIGVLSARPRRDSPTRQAEMRDWFALPRQYGKPGVSGLACDVTGSRVQHDIEMK
jgi:hypothetical protein